MLNCWRSSCNGMILRADVVTGFVILGWHGFPIILCLSYTLFFFYYLSFSSHYLSLSSFLSCFSPTLSTVTFHFPPHSLVSTFCLLLPLSMLAFLLIHFLFSSLNTLLSLNAFFFSFSPLSFLTFCSVLCYSFIQCSFSNIHYAINWATLDEPELYS